MNQSAAIPAIDLLGRHISESYSNLVLGLGAPLVVLDQIKTLLWSGISGEVPAAGGDTSNQRLYLISSDHLPMRRLVTSGTATLSPTYRSGAFHRAHDLLWTTRKEVRPTEWIVLVPNYSRQETDGRLTSEAMTLAKDEHHHNRAVTSAGSDLLPAYGGMALIVGTPGDQGTTPAVARIGHVWQRKHATLEDLVQNGGLAGRALLGSRPLSSDDLSVMMLRLARLYQRLHDLDMVYTDPKPANIAFDLATQSSPVAQHPFARLGQGVSRLVHSSLAGLRRRFPGAPLRSQIGRLSFIDAESMQSPGYATDAAVPAVTAMTPSWTSPQVLCCLGTTIALKRNQASEASDVFHMAAIGYALVTGDAPQSQLMDERFRTAYLGDTTQVKGQGEPTSRFAQIAVEVRVQKDFSADHQRLAHLVAHQTISPACGALLSAGLTGGVTTFGDWTRRIMHSCFGRPDA